MVFILLPPLCLPQDGREVFLDICGFWLIGVWFWLDVIFVLLPTLCLPQDGGEAFLDAYGFWLEADMA